MKRILLSVMLGLSIVFVSCVKDEIFNGPASISNVAYSPSQVTPNDQVKISATITMIRGIKEASIVYKVNSGDYLSVPMTAVADTFSGMIPKQADLSEVTFYVKAITNGDVESQSAEKTYKVGAIAPNYAAITLNEVDGNTKFVELYNNSDASVNISGMAIIKNGVSLTFEDGSPSWIVPAGISLPARGFGIIKCSGYIASASPSALIVGVVGNGMSAKQTLLLELTKPDGTVVNTFQRGVAPWGVTISAVAGTNSFSRTPDGSGGWKLALSTPGTTNSASLGDIPPL